MRPELRTRAWTSRAKVVGLACSLLLAAGCRQDMHDQPLLEPYEESSFFADGLGDRLPVEGTVARGQLREDEEFYTGLAGDSFVTALPMPNTRELLDSGRERYDIFCSPCHGRLGDGLGMIVRRGFKQPASFHEERLRNQPVGYFFDVITRGFGEMSSYAAQIEPEERWAIAGYIRALQLSQRVELSELGPAVRSRVESAIQAHDEPEAAPQSSAEAHSGSAEGEPSHE